MSKPLLFTYFRSSCAWRVRIALNYKSIDYDNTFIHLLKDGGEQNHGDYLKVNPMGQVPALKLEDGQVLTQSISILEYLEERYPTPSLLPKDIIARSQVRTICEMIASGIQPAQNLRLLNKLYEDSGGTCDKQEWARYWINKGFIALEQMLSVTSGMYCVGDMITMADVCLVPQFANALRFNVDTEQFPVISRIHSVLESQPAFKAAHPLSQPDCPPEMKK